MEESLENKLESFEANKDSGKKCTIYEIAATAIFGAAIFGFAYFMYEYFLSDELCKVREQINHYMSNGFYFR